MSGPFPKLVPETTQQSVVTSTLLIDWLKSVGTDAADGDTEEVPDKGEAVAAVFKVEAAGKASEPHPSLKKTPAWWRSTNTLPSTPSWSSGMDTPPSTPSWSSGMETPPSTGSLSGADATTATPASMSGVNTPTATAASSYPTTPHTNNQRSTGFGNNPLFTTAETNAAMLWNLRDFGMPTSAFESSFDAKDRGALTQCSEDCLCRMRVPAYGSRQYFDNEPYSGRRYSF